MNLRFSVAVALVFGLTTFAGCGLSPDQSSDERADVSRELVANGCREICPKCPPNKLCPLSPCYLDCSIGHDACVQTVACIIGDVWSKSSCSCVPDHGGKPGSCSTDADCRVVADYCTSCACDAFSTNQSAPTCSGPGVRCLVDPCAGHSAVCLGGSCTVQ